MVVTFATEEIAIIDTISAAVPAFTLWQRLRITGEALEKVIKQDFFLTDLHPIDFWASLSKSIVHGLQYRAR